MIFKGYEHDRLTSLFMWCGLNLIQLEYFCIESIKFTLWQFLVVSLHIEHVSLTNMYKTKPNQTNPEKVSLNKFIC